MAWLESLDSLGYCPPIHEPSHAPNTDFLLLVLAGTAVGHTAQMNQSRSCFSCTAQQTVHGTDTLAVGVGS